MSAALPSVPWGLLYVFCAPVTVSVIVSVNATSVSEP